VIRPVKVGIDADDNRTGGMNIGLMIRDGIVRGDLFHATPVILTWIGRNNPGDGQSVQWSGPECGKKSWKANWSSHDIVSQRH
jgi:hypothetical protein